MNPDKKIKTYPLSPMFKDMLPAKHPFKKMWQGTEHQPGQPIPGKHLSKLGNGYLIHLYMVAGGYVLFLPFATVFIKDNHTAEVFPPYVFKELKDSGFVLTAMIKCRRLKKLKKAIVQSGHMGLQLLPFLHNVNEKQLLTLHGCIRPNLMRMTPTDKNMFVG